LSWNPSDEGGFTVFVPALPGCISEGDTERRSPSNIREAIDLYSNPLKTTWLFPEAEELEIAV